MSLFWRGYRIIIDLKCPEGETRDLGKVFKKYAKDVERLIRVEQEPQDSPILVKKTWDPSPANKDTLFYMQYGHSYFSVSYLANQYQ